MSWLNPSPRWLKNMPPRFTIALMWFFLAGFALGITVYNIIEGMLLFVFSFLMIKLVERWV